MNLGFSIGGLAGGGKITRAVWKVGFRLDFIIIQIVFFNHAKSSNVNRATCYYAIFFFLDMIFEMYKFDVIFSIAAFAI
jgi:hypothetical protein